MTRRVHKSAESLLSCLIYVSGVTAVEKPEVAGSNLVVGHKFDMFSDTSEHSQIFSATKTGFFDKLRVSRELGSFP